jgi:hypothetical protein
MEELAKAVAELKAGFVHTYRGSSHFYEVIPVEPSRLLPVDGTALALLHRFAENNPIYFRSYDTEVFGIRCRVYEGDVSKYWLGSIKHDTSYQPFYPTWILSAYALAAASKGLSYSQLVDIGSGDGRIAYCAAVAGMQSYGIEIDGDLVALQERISSQTGVHYNVKKADATRFDYSVLNLTKPVFFISGLPEMGEMLANSVIEKVLSMPGMQSAGFVFMGSHVPRKYARDLSKWGWGSVIEHFSLEVLGAITLPTQWTADQPADTPYVFTRRADL